MMLGTPGRSEPKNSLEGGSYALLLRARALWLEGHDTLEIAKRLNLPESEIYNWIDLLKGARR